MAGEADRFSIGRRSRRTLCVEGRGACASRRVFAMNEDPARLFFPEGDVDLYEVLGLSRAENPSEEAIRKAYRKRALQSHPDKAHLRGKEAADQAAHAFQQVGFAYSVLSDPDRRKRYDRTGSTSDSIFEDGDIDWNAYFQTLWDGEVNADTLEEFKQKYQGSPTLLTQARKRSGRIFCRRIATPKVVSKVFLPPCPAPTSSWTKSGLSP